MSDPILNEIVNKLKSEFKLLKVYLFGSRSAGNAGPDSDYDIVAIVPDSKISRLRREIDARVVLADLPAAIDIFVYTEEEFEDASNRFGSVAELAVTEGMEIPV